MMMTERYNVNVRSPSISPPVLRSIPPLQQTYSGVTVVGGATVIVTKAMEKGAFKRALEPPAWFLLLFFVSVLIFLLFI